MGPEDMDPEEEPGGLPPDSANPFVEGVLGKETTYRPGSQRPEGKPRRTKPRKLVGFLAKALADPNQPRRLYLDEALDSWVSIPRDAIVYGRRLLDRKTGLERDVVWVSRDAELVYSSERRPRRRGSTLSGGNGVPPGRF